tara:strand:- start:38 stop:580 length:543 start_codon:yes stop_codon:yes gene_type:complete
MGTSMAQNNPLIMTSLEKNIFEHMNLMADEQVQLEFKDKIAQVQQIQQQMQQQQQQLQIEIESRKAVLIAEMTEDFVKEQKEAIGDLGNDPLVKLRARELDLKAQENMRRQKEDDARLNLDKMKSLMNQNLQEEKMEQQEDLAILRATTSLEKQKMSNKVKIKNDQMKQQDVRILKRPRS